MTQNRLPPKEPTDGSAPDYSQHPMAMQMAEFADLQDEIKKQQAEIAEKKTEFLTGTGLIRFFATQLKPFEKVAHYGLDKFGYERDEPNTIASSYNDPGVSAVTQGDIAVSLEIT